MKKTILRATLFVAFALMTGYGVYTSQQETEMSDLAMANVEALASGESGGIQECVGCIVKSNNLCKTYGDWGACVGDSDGYTKDL